MTLKFCVITVASMLLFNNQNVYCQYPAFGQVNDIATNAIPGARITLYDTALTYFREIRTDASGAFSIANVPAGNYILGVEKINKDFVQQSVNVPMSVPVMIALNDETQPGQWNIIVNSPEPLGGTDLGVLLPNGKIFYCHNSKEPFYFDPATNDTMSFAGDIAVQGCVGPVLLPNGLIVFAGGTLQNIYGPGTRKVKTYNPLSNQWVVRDSILDYRWYPTITKLADNRLLIAGGGNLNNPQRTNTSEIYNTSTWTSGWTDTLAVGNEVSPVVLLYNNKVLMTHRPPQLFDPVTNQWDSAGQFVQGPRMPNGDHADHELVLMPGGEAIAIGYKSFIPGVYGTFVERYNPTSDSWTTGSSILPIRSRAKTVLLPDKKILVTAGFKEDPSDTTSVNVYGYMNICDIYNPASDSWRRLSRINYYREYHCNTILVPDGRVIAVGGEGQPGNEPLFSVIEAFNPPYLYRGLRPLITSLDTIEHSRGDQINLTVLYADSVTAISLMSTAVVTHFMNSGNNRFLELNFVQSGNNINASIPGDSVTAPDGYYMLFVMVDDVPSVAKIIRITGNSTTTGILGDHNINSNILIYPNPSSDFITINLSEENSGYQFEMLNTLGETIIKTKNQRKIDISAFASGIYFLRVRQGNNFYSQKFIKQ